MKTLLAALVLAGAPLALVACQPADEVDTATSIENMETEPEVIVTRDTTVADTLSGDLRDVGSAIGDAARGAAGAVRDAANDAANAVTDTTR